MVGIKQGADQFGRQGKMMLKSENQETHKDHGQRSFFHKDANHIGDALALEKDDVVGEDDFFSHQLEHQLVDLRFQVYHGGGDSSQQQAK